jgi:hypothetical protein
VLAIWNLTGFLVNKEIIMYFIPKEFVIGGIYFPPLLIAGSLGVLAAALTA